MIPVVDGNERVDKLHPVFFRRVEALCADPRMEGRLAAELACLASTPPPSRARRTGSRGPLEDEVTWVHGSPG